VVELNDEHRKSFTGLQQRDEKGEASLSTETNKAAARRFIEEIFSQGHVALIDERCAPDFILHEPPRPDVRTREALKPFISEHLSAIPDFHVTIDDLLAEGEQVVARYTVHGTNAGDFVSSTMRIPATGKQFTVTGIYIFRFAEGKIVEAWDQADDLGTYQQLGLIPAPEPVG
jgi:steroid delta-isomerase-like uncharacterized protein